LRFSTSTLGKDEFGKAIIGTKQMYEEAKERNHENGVGTALFILADIYGAMNRLEEEEKYRRECIEVSKNKKELKSELLISYIALSDLLIKKEHYDEAIEIALEYERLTIYNEEISKSKIPALWLNLWVVYVNLHIAQEKYEQAEIYCKKLDSIGDRKSVV
jgi:tetratricopeptide (TPR) repeat protein